MPTPSKAASRIGGINRQLQLTEKQRRELASKGGKAAVKKHPGLMTRIAKKKWADWRAKRDAKAKAQGAAA